MSAFFLNKPPIPILRNIEFNLANGQTLCVIGQSGSGKSTLVHAIGGIFPSPNIRKTRGTIRVGDREMTPESASSILGRMVGVVFQDPWSTLTPVYTCGDQVVEILRLHCQLTKTQAKTTALEILQRVGFSDPHAVFGRYPHELSGGMCQRVGIAMAIAPQPKVLIADEPTTALDPTVQETILVLLNTLQTELGLSILLVTHSLSVASRMADHVLVLQSGTVVEEGSILDIFDHPKHAYTAKLVRDFGNFGVRS